MISQPETNDSPKESNDIMMPDTKHLVVSSSPHFHTRDSVRSIMICVILALLPACLAGFYYFGWRALWVLLICTASCAGFEAIFTRLMNKDSELNDASALVTGLLLGMNLPPATPEWICIVGSFIAIGVGKMLYGGFGNNPFNPALVGRVALLVAFPKVMTTWTIPHGFFASSGSDAVTGATPLGILGSLTASVEAGSLPDLSSLSESVTTMDAFLGNVGGCIGETCAPALILGGVFLMYKKIIRWQVPLTYLLTVFIIAGAARLISPSHFASPFFHLFSGGLMLGAFFMATDMVTTPLSRTGGIIFALGCGIITTVIRLWGSYPEGVSFSILIMNAFTPLIDRCTAGRPFGAPKKKGLSL